MSSRRRSLPTKPRLPVMAGLVPAIHELEKKDVDAQHKAGQDRGRVGMPTP